MAARSDAEAKELALVEKVELRIALADSESKLQTVLNTYLAPLLLKLASEHLSVRNKVISICQHVNTRTKSQNVHLPVTALLKQFKDYSHVPLIRHFDLVYIQQGVARLSDSEIAQLLPILSSGIAKYASSPTPQSAAIFNILLRSLSRFKLPQHSSQANIELRKTFEVSDDDSKFLAHWFGKLLLFRAGLPQGASTVEGLSPEEFNFLSLESKGEVWDPANPTGLSLTETKLNVLKLLSSGLFNDDERLFPALFASADRNSNISGAAEDLLKRVIPNVSTEEHDFVSKLYRIYLGNSTGSAGSVLPPRRPVRTKILNILTRSTKSTTFPNDIVRVVEKDLVSDQSLEEASANDRELLNLRTAVIAFLTHVTRNASASDLDIIARPLVQGLRDFIQQHGDNSPSSLGKSLVGNSYEILGLLASSSKSILVEPNLEILQWLFEALAGEKDKNLVVSINEALSTTIRTFRRHRDSLNESLFRNILINNVKRPSNNDRSVLYTSVCFANRCLPYSDVIARWIDILAITQGARATHETIEEAKKGLDPYWHHLYNTDGNTQSSSSATLSIKETFPSFKELASFVFSQDEVMASPEVLSLTISYTRSVLFLEGLSDHPVSKDLTVEWERKMDLAVSEDQSARLLVRNHLEDAIKDPEYKQGILLQWKSAFGGLASEVTNSRLSCARVLLELSKLSPQNLLRELPVDLRPLESAVLANDINLRNIASETYGFLASGSQSASAGLDQSLNGFCTVAESWKDAIGQNVNKVHGAIQALVYFACHAVRREMQQESAAQVIRRLLPTLFAILDQAHDTLLQQASITALGNLCLFQVISLESFEGNMSFSTMTDKFASKSQAGDEKAITALGFSSMILDEDDGDHVKELLEKLHKLHEIRQPETQFSVGEAITYLAAGWDSKILVSKLDVDSPVPPKRKREKTMAATLERVFKDCETTKPSLKKASVIWLLCFIQFCGDHTEIQARLAQFQAAFKRFLSSQDELIQESASRGLGLVYEKGSREIKDDLVRDLVNSFSSNRADMSGTVAADTQLFEPGQLPTGDGSITTYKDIMNLASEVGDSSLVYRFMSLASNNAIWSSRAAFGRFGLSNVLSDSSVDGYLAANPKLYPKLYRYRFDPNSNVRKSMTDIWNALVKDSSATIETHFDEIMKDLLKSVLGREWRVRQASCAAIADLVQGRKIERVQPYLEEIWTSCFKVLDDIKESVRAAAAALARVMTQMLLRNLETAVESSATTNQMLNGVLPFLMSTSGLESSAEDVRNFSLTTLLQIVKKGQSETLKPFIPALIERLLGLLTSFEPELVNYLHLNAAKYNMTEQKIDEARLSSIRSGPLMEAIERCLDLVDDETMQKLAPGILNAMKAAVGMPSKVGCSRILVSLSTRRSVLFRPYCDRFLDATQKCVLDRNETVSSSYAAAMGYIARGASDKSILNSLAFAKRLYFESEEERSRVTSGEVLLALSKQATDRVNSLASEFLPFVYVARHDGVDKVKELYKTVWEETAGGPRAVSLYLKEIVALSAQHMSSNRWIVKHAAALAVAGAAEALTAMHSETSEVDAETLWPTLKLALAEKSWEGKERVLDGFVSFAKSGAAYWKSRPEVQADIAKIAIREARRRNASYRTHALAALGKIAEVVEDGGMTDAVFEIAQAVVDELADEERDAMQVEQAGRPGGPDAEQVRNSTLSSAAEALLRSVNAAGVGSARVERVLDLLLGASHIKANPVYSTVYFQISRLLGTFWRDAKDTASPLDRTLFDDGDITLKKFAALLLGPPDAMSEGVRLQRAEAILALAKLVALVERPAVMLDALAAALSNESAPAVRRTLAEALNTLKQQSRD